MVRLMHQAGIRLKRLCGYLFCLASLLLSLNLSAAVTASVDRNQIGVQDIINLTLRSDREAIAQNLDLSELQKHFEVINRNQKNEIRYVNGQRSANYDLVFAIAPKRSGDLLIPAFNIQGDSTQPIRIRVADSAASAGAKAQVFLDSSVSKQEVYVQERFIYTIRVFHSVGLDGPSLSPIEIENASQVQQLGEQQKYETIIAGVRYSVVELKYSIVPKASGRLEIPAQTLVASTMTQWGSVFRNDNRRIRVQSPTQVLNVLPKPAQYPKDQPWLPTPKLTLSDSWADRTIQLYHGEPQTRSISIRANNLDAAQLPVLEDLQVMGAKIYPDQPSLNDQNTLEGVIGERTESAAIVPTAEGSIELPEVAVTWWNTDTNQLEVSKLPPRRLLVKAARQAPPSPLAPPLTPETDAPAPAEATGSSNTLLWQVLSLMFAGLWLATLVLWWKKPRPAAQKLATSNDLYRQRLESRHQALQALQQAVKNDQPEAARPALLAWLQAVFPHEGLTSLDDAMRKNLHPDFNPLVQRLQSRLYSDNASQEDWQGQALLNLLEEIRKAQKKQPVQAETSPLASLYPL